MDFRIIPATALAAGIALATMTHAQWWWGIITIAFASAGYMAIMRASGDPVKTFRLQKWHNVWTAVLFVGIGVTDQSLNRPLTAEETFEEETPAYLTGEIRNILHQTYGDRLEVTIDGTNGASAWLRTGATTLTSGDIVTFPADRLKKISADTSAMMRKIAPMLESRGILYHASIGTNDISPAGRSQSLHAMCVSARDRIEVKIEKSILNRPTQEFIKAILMGDKSGLDEQTRLTFSHGGTAHMLALSGLHMGIIAGLLLWIMLPVSATGRYKWGYGASILLLWCYVFLTGASHSSVRACVMITFAFAAVIAERKNSAANALCSACLLILLIEPSALFDAGFQLSVVCVASLIAFATRLNPVSHRRHPILYRICGAVLATIAASLASLPLTSYYFGQIPLMFLPTNVLLLPLIPVYLSLGLIFTALLCAGYEPGILASALDSGYEFLIQATGTLSSGADYVLEYQMPLWGLALWMISALTGALALNRTKK